MLSSMRLIVIGERAVDLTQSQQGKIELVVPQDADYVGFDFWLQKLNQFNGDYINAEMVKAFITSGEYRQRFGP